MSVIVHVHIAHQLYRTKPRIKMTDPDPHRRMDERGWWEVGKVRNGRSDIVTRVESTPKKKVRLQGVNLHTTIQGEKGEERWTRGKVRDKRNESEDPLTVTQYPVRDI